MPEFKTIAQLSEVEPGSLKQVEIDDETEICLANVDGTVYAINGQCTHEGGPLGEGELDGKVVMCPWHSGEFDVTTGAVVGPPPEESAKTYEVRVEGDDIQVAIGD